MKPRIPNVIRSIPTIARVRVRARRRPAGPGVTWGLLALLLGVGAGPRAVAAAPERPNVLVILADDFGYGSLGCYGAPTALKTPNLDRLAKEGRRFMQAYAPGSVCSPTRYALMTGRYYWRTSVKDGEVLPGNAPLHIEPGRMTLASLCKGKGYETAAFGKWHLGMGADGRITDWSGSLKPGPLEIGFDHFFGMASNPWSGPHSFIEDHEVTGKVPGRPVVVDGNREDSTTSGIAKKWDEHQITATLTEKAVGWLEQERKGPVLLYFAHTAVHRPDAPNPKFTGSPYGIYGDFIQELDWSVGQLLEALDRRKLTEDTLVIFTSDNGGVVVNTAEHAVAQAAGLKINGPLRGGKHDIWEGGFREPFLVRWPGKVPAGTVSDQVVCITDILATVAGILGVVPGPGQAEDSFDAREAFFATSPAKPVRDHVIVQDAHATYAIREGDWKLVEHAGSPAVAPRNKAAAKKQAAARKGAAPHDELFNLADDPAETRDVHAEHPDLVSRLKKRLSESRERRGTRPGGDS
jgi:arylsulfatase A